MDIQSEQIIYLAQRLEDMEADTKKTRRILSAMMNKSSLSIPIVKKAERKVRSERKKVPKSVKDRLWDTTFGSEVGEAECYVCSGIINSKRFEAGHVIAVANGGDTVLSNLRCICGTCNKSMGTTNLEEFKETYFPSKKEQVAEIVYPSLKQSRRSQVIEYNIPDLSKFIYKPMKDGIEKSLSIEPCWICKKDVSSNLITEKIYYDCCSIVVHRSCRDDDSLISSSVCPRCLTDPTD